MPVAVSLKALETHDSIDLEGVVPSAELDIEAGDDAILEILPLEYRLTAQLVENEVLVTGDISLDLRCECVRCLESFIYTISLPDYALLLPLDEKKEGDTCAEGIDLTPHLRDDALLEFPQHPLCGENCTGIRPQADSRLSDPQERATDTPSVWDELNRLKL